MVALLNNNNEPMEKDDLMQEAEELKIRRFKRGGTIGDDMVERSVHDSRANGYYDAWSGVNKDLLGNNHGGVLMLRKNRKHKLSEIGVDVTKALHAHAHALKLCACLGHNVVAQDSSDNFMSVTDDSPFKMCKVSDEQ